MASAPMNEITQRTLEREDETRPRVEASLSNEPRTLTGAQIIWETLVREGVEVVFGYPGGAIMPAYDALLDYPIHHVLVRHEQGAAHMADGYARASRQGRRCDRDLAAPARPTWSPASPPR